MKTSIQSLMAFDYGTRSIGVAIGQTITNSARPLPELRAIDGIPNWNEVEALLKEWLPELVLVGLPLHMDGTESEFALRTRKFARRLHGRFGVQVQLMDERLSTREAKNMVGHRDSYRDQPVDSLAAQLIMESWFNEPAQAKDI